MNLYPLEYFKAVQDVLCSEENVGDDPFAKEILDALASVGAISFPPASVQGKPTLADVDHAHHLICTATRAGDGYKLSVKSLEFVAGILLETLALVGAVPTAEPPATVDAEVEVEELERLAMIAMPDENPAVTRHLIGGQCRVCSRRPGPDWSECTKDHRCPSVQADNRRKAEVAFKAACTPELVLRVIRQPSLAKAATVTEEEIAEWLRSNLGTYRDAPNSFAKAIMSLLQQREA